MDIDNCWLAVSKDDLALSEGFLEIVAYNQALLTASTSFKVNNDISFLLGTQLVKINVHRTFIIDFIILVSDSI